MLWAIKQVICRNDIMQLYTRNEEYFKLKIRYQIVREQNKTPRSPLHEKTKLNSIIYFA